jgi:hypothetical protein
MNKHGQFLAVDFLNDNSAVSIVFEWHRISLGIRPIQCGIRRGTPRSIRKQGNKKATAVGCGLDFKEGDSSYQP